MRFEKLIGRYVEIIYLSADGRLTQRIIYVHSIRHGWIRAFCTTAKSPRTFRTESILACLPTIRPA